MFFRGSLAQPCTKFACVCPTETQHTAEDLRFMFSKRMRKAQTVVFELRQIDDC